jgi:hypothetical protein
MRRMIGSTFSAVFDHATQSPVNGIAASVLTYSVIEATNRSAVLAPVDVAGCVGFAGSAELAGALRSADGDPLQAKPAINIHPIHPADMTQR